MRGILRPCRYETAWLKEGYKNCLVLPISTRCIFFSVAHSIRTPQLNVLNLEQFWDGWPTGKFSGKRASEDKTRWKDSCWFVESVGNPKSSLGCYKWYQSRPLPVRCGSGTNQAEAGGHVTPTADENRGVVASAQDTTMSGSQQFLEKPNHIGMREILRPCRYETTWLKEGYKNCLVLPISIRCIFFLVAHSIRTPQLSVLKLEQFWDGWPTGKFSGKRASEDKTRWKDSCWFVESVDNPKSSLGCYK